MSNKLKERKAQELLNIQSSGGSEPPNKENYLDEVGYTGNDPNINKPLENTPFWVRGNNIDGYIITMGQYRLTVPFHYDHEILELEDVAKGILENQKWDIIVRVISSALDAFEKNYTDEFEYLKGISQTKQL